jgi:hypothetical protein
MWKNLWCVSWWSSRWLAGTDRLRDTWDKSPEERAFLNKLDSALLTYAALSYFSK